MYSYIEGIVTNKFLSSICITINGLGYEVFVLDVDKYKLNDTCKLFLYDYIKENVEIIIFGFQDFEQLTMFKKLLLVNGIGPKSALSILKHNNVNVLVSLIKEVVSKNFSFKEIIVTVAGSVVTSHCGQGTLGVLFIKK